MARLNKADVRVGQRLTLVNVTDLRRHYTGETVTVIAGPKTRDLSSNLINIQYGNRKKGSLGLDRFELAGATASAGGPRGDEGDEDRGARRFAFNTGDRIYVAGQPNTRGVVVDGSYTNPTRGAQTYVNILWDGQKTATYKAASSLRHVPRVNSPVGIQTDDFLRFVGIADAGTPAFGAIVQVVTGPGRNASSVNVRYIDSDDDLTTDAFNLDQFEDTKLTKVQKAETLVGFAIANGDDYASDLIGAVAAGYGVANVGDFDDLVTAAADDSAAKVVALVAKAYGFN